MARRSLGIVPLVDLPAAPVRRQTSGIPLLRRCTTSQTHTISMVKTTRLKKEDKILGSLMIIILSSIFRHLPVSTSAESHATGTDGLWRTCWISGPKRIPPRGLGCSTLRQSWFRLGYNIYFRRNVPKYLLCRFSGETDNHDEPQLPTSFPNDHELASKFVDLLQLGIGMSFF